MANWSLPTLTSTYTNFLTEVTGRDTDVALGLDPANTTVTNPPTNAIRWNSANNRWEKFNGTTWGTLSATYAFTAITTTGNASVGGTLSVTGATTLAAATATTPLPGAVSTEVVTAAWVNNKAFAPLASPALTGTPTAPTAAVNTSTTQVATTAFVLGQANSTAATVAMNGTQAAGTSTLWARADHVHPTDTSRAPLASPTFTGTPAAPTAAADTNTTQVATTAFVVGQASSTSPAMDGTATVGTSLRYARADHIHPTDTSRAPAASPSFTGTASFAGDITMTGTGFLDLPVGTTAQRPGSPAAGMIRYNSTLGQFEGYTTSWDILNADLKNRIINGDMRIDQRYEGAAAGASINGYVVDRWQVLQSTAGKLNAGRNLGSVTPPAGFTNYLGAQSQSAYSLAASDYFTFTQVIEGLNASDLAWGTASAQSVTLSFSVRSSLTGTFSGTLKNGAQNRSYPFTYSITSANTWTSVSITIPGDTSGTWASDNTAGIYVNFSLGAGSTFSGTAGAWASANLIGANGGTSVVGTNAATFYITGVQLETGTTASPFERRSYGLELGLCQRYAAVGLLAYQQGYIASGGYLGVSVTLPARMRTTPTLTQTATSNANVGTTVLGSSGFQSVFVYAPGINIGAATLSSTFNAIAEL
jgi:hypothetical protein